ncbi:MAG: hypothetical protein JST80_01210 [Bdellovibrionales bacterium]|nr:hypothetical protein [Bdellovibrionales bacterium]
MELQQQTRDAFANVFNGFLGHSKDPTWATLWYQPSKLEPDVVKLVAVMDNAKTVKTLMREQDQIVSVMRSSANTSGMRLFMEIIPSSEFHSRYQNQTGYELIREWNGDDAEFKRPMNLWSTLFRSKATKIILPVMIAGLLILIIKIFTVQGL